MNYTGIDIPREANRDPIKNNSLDKQIDHCKTGIVIDYNYRDTYVDDCVMKFYNGTVIEIKPEKTFDTKQFSYPSPPTDGTFHATLNYEVMIYPGNGTEKEFGGEGFAATVNFEDHVGFHTILDGCDTHESSRWLVRGNCVLEFSDGTIYKMSESKWQPTTRLFEATITYNATAVDYKTIDIPGEINAYTSKSHYFNEKIKDCKTGIPIDYTYMDTYVDDCVVKFYNGTIIEIKPEKTFDTKQFSYPPPPTDGTFHATLKYNLTMYTEDWRFVRMNGADYFSTTNFENHVGFHTVLDGCGMRASVYDERIRDSCKLEFYDGTLYRLDGRPEQLEKNWILVETSLER